MDRTEPQETFTVEETAALLRIGKRQAYEGIRRGQIPSIKIGHRILVPRAQLDRLLAGDAGSAA